MGIVQKLVDTLPFSTGLRRAPKDVAKVLINPYESAKVYLTKLLEPRAWQANDPLSLYQRVRYDHPSSPLLQILTFHHGEVYLLKFTGHRANSFNTIRMEAREFETADGAIRRLCFSRPGLPQEVENSLVPISDIWTDLPERDQIDFNPRHPPFVVLGRNLFYGNCLNGKPTSLLNADTVSRNHANLFFTPDPDVILIQNLANKGIQIERIE